MPRKKTETDEARFSRKFVRGEKDECWIWTAGKCLGYGVFSVGSRTDGTVRLVKAHRIAYKMAGNTLYDRDHIDHLCRRKDCVNPAHLEAVSAAENTLRWAKTITHCPDGHAYQGDNVRYVGNKRTCRVCDRLRKTPNRKRAWIKYR